MAVAPAIRRGAPDAHAIAEGALFADLTILVVLLGLYVPYAGPAMAAISPVPLLLLALRRGWRVCTEATIVACLLVAFLAGPFSALPVLTIAFRSAALAIGLRKGWQAGRTVLAGTTFLWIVVWIGVTCAALAFPSWRSATEQGIADTFRAGASLVGFVFVFLHQGNVWHQSVAPAFGDFISWFLAHWLLLLPVVAWPVLLIAVGAEYIIAEVVLPRFGVTPPPLSLFGFQATVQPAAAASARQPGLRARVLARLEAELAVRQEQLRQRREHQRAGSKHAAMEPVRSSDRAAQPVHVVHPPDGSSGD